MNKLKGLLLATFFVAFFAACSSIVPPPAMAEVKDFAWTPPTTYMNDLPITAPLLYRVYCGVDAPVEAGSALELPIDSVLAGKPDGKYQCFFISYHTDPCPGMVDGNCESPPSAPLTAWKKGGRYYTGGEPASGQFRFR